MAVARAPLASPVLRTDSAPLGLGLGRPGTAGPVLNAGGGRAAGASPVLNAGGTLGQPLPDARAGTLTNTQGPPVPLPPNPTAPYTAPTTPTFGGTAPTSTPTGTFTAPDPSQVANDPYYQFRLAEGLKQQQRGAAAHGTLLTGGFQKALMGYGQGLASEEGQNIFNRALSAYDTNRDTNAQNFNQQMGTFQGNLGAFNANTSAALGYGHLGLEANQNAYDRQRQAGLDQRDYQQQTNNYNATNQSQMQATWDADFARKVAMQREQNAAILEAQSRRSPAPVSPHPAWR